MLYCRKRLSCVCMTLFFLLATGCADKTQEAEPSGPRLFSWDSAVLAAPQSQELFGWMAEEGFSVLYQAVPRDCDLEELAAFAQGAADGGIALYLLTGDPQWAADETGAQMRDEIERVQTINAALPEGAALRGVVMDVEPYLAPGWEGGEDAMMDAYASAMARACREAKGAGLEYIACIPYYFDTEGYTQQLEMLVRYGCTGLAVMNYDKHDEAGQIEDELELARDAGCTLTVIYEVQQPGQHGLSERNTYYEDGPAALAESWQAIVQACGGDGLAFAVHEYRAAREVWGRE